MFLKKKSLRLYGRGEKLKPLHSFLKKNQNEIGGDEVNFEKLGHVLIAIAVHLADSRGL